MPRLRTALGLLTLILVGVLAWRLVVTDAEPLLGPLSHDSRADALPRRDPQDPRPPTGREEAPAAKTRRRLADSRASATFTLMGTVVTAADRGPVAGALVCVGCRDDEGSTLATSTSTDVDGTFSVALPPVRFSRVWLDAETEAGSGAISMDIPGPYEGSRDLGEVELAGFDTIRFTVSSERGDPVAGALVHPVPGGSHVERAGPDGKGAIEVQPSVEALRALAPGYELAEIAKPPSGVAEFRLVPASTLTVRVTTADGPPNPERTTLSIEFAWNDPFPFGLYPHDVLWNLVGNTPLNQRTNRLFLDGGRAFATVSPVRAGSRLHLEALDASMKAQDSQAIVIGAAESRVVNLHLRGEFHRVRGRVTAASGVPLPGVTVLLGEDEVTRATDANGEFDFGAVAGQVTRLQVSSKKHAMWEAQELPLQGNPVLVALEDGVPLKVRVFDADGVPVKGASVYACDRFDITDREGRVALVHLPLGSVRIRVFFDGTNHDFDHHTAVPEVTLRLEPEKR